MQKKMIPGGSMNRFINVARLTLILLSTFAQAQPETVINVQLTGGGDAGSYEVTQEDSSCLYGTSNGDDWRTLYGSDTSQDGTLSTVLLVIPNTTEAASGSTDFFFSAGLNEYGGEAYLEYILDPPNGNGTGTVTVQKDGSQATLNISGQTSAGLEVNATITCTNVLEVGGEPKALSKLGEVTFAPDSSAPTGSVSLTIADKSYHVQTSDEATCVKDVYDQVGVFQYSYYVDGYTNFDIFIRNFQVNGEDTSDFGFSMNSYYLVYRTGEGTGTVKATQAGDQLTLEVDVQTVEGIPVRATLTCLLAP
jgi:hypothetical protein